MKHELAILNHTGHSTMTWADEDIDKEALKLAEAEFEKHEDIDKEALKLAEAEFEKLKKRGWAGFKDDGKGGGEFTKAFDATAERIVMMPQMVDG